MPEGEPGSVEIGELGVQDWASGSRTNPRRGRCKAAVDSERGALRTELIPWDDADFVRNRASLRKVLREGLLINGPRAAVRLEVLMRAAGYAHVSVKVDRTVDEALHHAARWTVRRDGQAASDRR